MPELTENVANFAIWCLGNSLDENTVFFAVSKFQADLTVWVFSTVVSTLLETFTAEIHLLSASYSKEC